MKVVILPIFNEGCFLPYWVPNICDIVEPDLIILNEGLFPRGVEDDTKYKESFYTKFTKDGHSFDIEEVERLLTVFDKVYPDVEFQLNLMDYPKDFYTGDAYYTAYTYGLPKDLKADDIVLPIEADLFFHEDDKEYLHQMMKEHDDESPAMSMFQRYFVSPFIRIYPDKPRKIFCKWGDGNVYHATVRDNFSETYQKRGTVYPIRAYHFEWVRGTGKYWDARMQMFMQSRSKEMMDWHQGAQEEIYRCGKPPNFTVENLSIEFVPTEDHPQHFRNHPDYKYFRSMIDG